MLVVVALLVASADAVMALSPGYHTGLNTADIWTFFSGFSPETQQSAGGFGLMLMACPAWVVLGFLGAGLLFSCRPRRRRFRFARRG
jgi:hypothetical protein